MDNQTYLNQISAAARPVKKQNSFLSSNIFKIAAIGIAATIFIIIIGSLLSSANNKSRDLSEQLSVRMTNLSETIDEYNEFVKSSSLRSIGTSFKTILTDTNRDLTNILVEKYKFKPNKISKKLESSETDFITELNDDLETARLNGILDRTYSSKIDLQITLLISLESDILSRTSNNDIKTILQNSTANLESLQQSLDEYSNTY